MEVRIPDCLTPRPKDPKWRPPLDALDLAVRLEAEGVTDSVAAENFDFPSTLDMARHFYPTMIGHPVPPPSVEAPAHTPLRSYLRGISFALPMLCCALTLLAAGFSLWGGDVSSDVASAVAIGTVTSFVVTGGFVQAMARRGLFYIGVREYRAAASVCRRWASIAAFALASCAAFGLVLNRYYAWLPWPLDLTATGFALLLGAFWLLTGVLYMLERNLWITASTAAGIATVGVLHKLGGIPLVPSQLIGISVACGVAAWDAVRWFRAKCVSDKSIPRPFRPGRELYLAGPYFVYGLLYYLFLFADRIVAWTAHTSTAALPLQFRGDYETALDLAMIAFALQVGWVHSSLAAFQRRASIGQKVFRVEEAWRFNRDMQSFYLRTLARYAPLALAASIGVFLATRLFGLLPYGGMTVVLGVSLLAFPILVAGLWNISLLFSLDKAKAAIAAAAAGAASSFAVGYMLSRIGTYDAAVFGFLIGACGFAALSTFSVLRVLASLDHHYFASAV